MKKKWSYPAAACGTLLILSIGFAGCGTKNAVSDKQQPVPTATPPAVSGSTIPAVSAPISVQSPAASDQEKLAGVNNNVSQAAADNKPTPQNSTKPKKTFDSYSIDKPQLVGIAIGNSISETAKLHGNASSTYVMDDSEDPITVHEYDGFIVGYNGKKQVEFIEITKDTVDPGLNGFHLGQTTADAAKALGKPDSITDYVMTYKTKQTILKLDLETKNKTIQSIKLFGRNE
ncbi:MAG: hypothetical protein K0R57_6508 [Paenibacillaceae bacterium]|jgi:hypothetical protein|nr:hypothetical protein [Paenibacillaceae bacterium]